MISSRIAAPAAVCLPARRTQRAVLVRAEGNGEGDSKPKMGAFKVQPVVGKTDEAASTSTSAPSSPTPPAQEKVTQPEGIDVSKIPASTPSPEPSEKMNLVQGALEEARLIDWPSPVDALSNTGVVILIVIGSTAALFGINTALAQLSTIIFR